MEEDIPSLPDHPIAEKRRAGVCLPLWSILTEKSFESGDIYSLEALVPWMEKTGFSILQILPLNDCGMGSSPYSSLSSFAIDPLYISLHKLGLNVYSRKRKIENRFINKKRITEIKILHLRKLFLSDTRYSEEAKEFIKKFPWTKPYLSYKNFYLSHNGKHWKDWELIEGVNGYTEGLFDSLLRDSSRQEEIYFQAWLQKIAYEQLSEVKQLYSDNNLFLKGDMPILTSSNSADVWAMRDIYRIDLQTGAPPDAFSSVGQNWGFPILNWEKLDELDYKPWEERLRYQENFFHLYRIDHVIGIYRLWAIPLRAKSAKYGFFYPQKAVSHEEFIRENLDPNLAMDRNLISIMPSDIPGDETNRDKLRYFFHWDFHMEPGFSSYKDEEKEKLYKLSFQNLADDEKNWKQAGEKVLKAFHGFTTMFPCSEDLGSVPGFVRDSLHENRIFGIDVIRWTRSFDDGSYIPGESYRRNALSTLSTHDTSLALDWWFHELKEGEKDYAIRFFLYPDPKESQENPRDLTTGKEFNSSPEPSNGGMASNIYRDKNPGEVLQKLLEFAFHSRSQFSIQMLQDVLFTGSHAITSDWKDHKINTPATPEEKNWKYRFSFLVEELLEETELNTELARMIQESGRKKS